MSYKRAFGSGQRVAQHAASGRGSKREFSVKLLDLLIHLELLTEGLRQQVESWELDPRYEEGIEGKQTETKGNGRS